MLVDCDNCGAIVDAEVIESFEREDSFIESFRFSFARCPRCSAAFLLREEEDLANSTGRLKVWEPPVRLFPSPPGHVNARLPVAIRSSFEEARKCFAAKAYTACAIMCRKTLDAICVNHGVRERNLAESLKKLRDNGVIEARLFSWADALRISGNEAAHDVDLNISRDDAVDIFDFTNALLEYVFTYRDRFEAFQKRRSSKQVAPNQAGVTPRVDAT